jgi:hypothetical protein
LVEQQKIDIEEETTATLSLRRGLKKETKHEQQQPSKSGEVEEQDNAAGAETQDLK